MGKFDGVLLVTDLDGTLFYKGDVSRENCEAIRYFQSEGGLFSVASGRYRKWLLDWQDFILPNTWCAMVNGAVICDRKGENVILQQPMDAGYLHLASRIWEACPRMTRVTFVSFEGPLFVSRGEPLPEATVEPVGYKMVFHVPAEDSDAYLQAVKELAGPQYLVMRSWINGIEVQKRGTGKGDAVRHMRRLLGNRVHTVVAVGDYENDLDMIREADVGYAVGNACDALKAVADRITVSAAEHAIARVIAEIADR